VARAQIKLWRIGWLDPNPPPEPEPREGLEVFRKALSELGYVEHRNYVNVATTLIPSRETPSQRPLSIWNATAAVQCPLVGGAMDSQGQPMSQLQYST
jgi:hypothetical protein